MSFFIYLSADGGCPDCSVWHFVHQYRLAQETDWQQTY